MNIWEILRARLEGDVAVAGNREGVRRAATVMAEAIERLDFARMGQALEGEWTARRRLAPVVSTPLLESAVAAARAAGAGGGEGRRAAGGGGVPVPPPPAGPPRPPPAPPPLGEGPPP